MNTNTNVPDTKQLTRKQKKWRRYRQYLNQKKLEKYGFVYDDDSDDYDSDEELINTYLSRMSYNDLDYQGLDKIAEQIYAERNSETHKQKMYDELDKFITENEPENIREFAISGIDLCHGKKMYNEMKNDPNPTPKYEIFASNSSGHQCFVLYKSKEQNMYIIKVNVQTPTDYVKIDDDTIFG
jgi:hypothetical protein